VHRVSVAILALVIFACPRAFAQNDLSGEWANLLHEDVNHRNDAIGGGPRIGDYTGLPINDAARMKADSWDAAIETQHERQTIFAPAAYWARGGGGMRISKVVDEASQQLIAYKIFRSAAGAAITRMIWMDGRPHPPDYVAHTWEGFSTGRWEGSMLTVTTTHVKAGYIQRNGVPASDRATITDHIVRHGDVLTIVSVVDDPIYLEEPFIRSTNWLMNLQQELTGVISESVDEIAGRPEGFVPHHLPGTNKWLTDAAREFGIPEGALRGGRETTYPEYRPK
jgi:hypothetical protein